ncbi:MAG: hypothetical protein JSR33_00105 [Proteobacteria bacterium]|nr:hypothetical protein [Pseudomonadota bacterium]
MSKYTLLPPPVATQSTSSLTNSPNMVKEVESKRLKDEIDGINLKIKFLKSNKKKNIDGIKEIEENKEFKAIKDQFDALKLDINKAETVKNDTDKARKKAFSAYKAKKKEVDKIRKFLVDHEVKIAVGGGLAGGGVGLGYEAYCGRQLALVKFGRYGGSTMLALTLLVEIGKFFRNRNQNHKIELAKTAYKSAQKEAKEAKEKLGTTEANYEKSSQMYEQGVKKKEKFDKYNAKLELYGELIQKDELEIEKLEAQLKDLEAELNQLKPEPLSPEKNYEQSSTTVMRPS